MDLNGARRKNATRETTSTLKAWLNEHKKNPYPTKGEKIMLAIITKMTLTQVSTWFANARRRLKKENKMTWEPRNRVEDEDNNNEDDDSGRKSVDEKDRLGESCCPRVNDNNFTNAAIPPPVVIFAISSAKLAKKHSFLVVHFLALFLQRSTKRDARARAR